MIEQAILDQLLTAKLFEKRGSGSECFGRTNWKRRYYIFEDTDQDTQTTHLKYYKKEETKWFYCGEWMIDLSNEALFEIVPEGLAIPIKIVSKKKGPDLAKDTRYAKFPRDDIAGLFAKIQQAFNAIGTSSSSFDTLKTNWQEHLDADIYRVNCHVGDDDVYGGPSEIRNFSICEPLLKEKVGSIFEWMILDE